MASINIQNLFSWDEIRKAFPEADDTAIDDYFAKTAIIRELIEGPSSGTGSPEGVITSGLTHFYVDTAALQLYWNPDVGVNTGWVAL